MQKTAFSHTVPFFANTPDNTHCFQAAVRMVLKYFLPDRDFSWETLEKMSAKLPGKATWPQQMLANLHQMGFEVVVVEGFDAKMFIAEGEAYLRRAFGKQVAEWQVANSDIAQEQRLYQALLDAQVPLENRLPTLLDVKHYLKQGYLLICGINSAELNHKPGYEGHSVVVYDLDDQNLVMHDPGSAHLPGGQARRLVTPRDFLAAWANPNEQAKNLIALKYPEVQAP